MSRLELTPEGRALKEQEKYESELDLHGPWEDMPDGDYPVDPDWIDLYTAKTTTLGFTVNDPSELQYYVFSDDGAPAFVKPLSPLLASRLTSTLQPPGNRDSATERAHCTPL
jgi:hypothetical protein